MIVFLDEWLIPKKSNYNKNHFYHESLVYGYDDNKRKIHCISFNEKQEFKNFEIDYDIFWEAYKLICDDPNDINIHQRYTYLIKPREITYKFNFENFLLQLTNYLHGKESIVNIYNFDLIDFPTENEDWTYSIGMNVFNRWIDIVKNIKEDDKLNYMDFHIIADHKKNMLNRLKYIYDNFFTFEELLIQINDYKLIAESFDMLRFQAIKFNQKHENGLLDLNKRNIVIEKIINSISMNSKKEEMILQNVLKLLDESI